LSENKLLTRICWGRVDSELGSLFVDPAAPLSKTRTLIAKLSLERITENGCGPDAFLFVFKGSAMQRSKETMRKTETISIEDEISRVIVITKDPDAPRIQTTENIELIPAAGNDDSSLGCMVNTKDVSEQKKTPTILSAFQGEGLQIISSDSNWNEERWENDDKCWGQGSGVDGDGWIVCQDNDGNTYYYNATTETTTWESPW
jgi:hypothetical protein